MSSENTSGNRTLDEFNTDAESPKAHGNKTTESDDSAPNTSSQETPSTSTVKIGSQRHEFQTGHPLSDEYLDTVAGAEMTVSSANTYEKNLRIWIRYLDEKVVNLLSVDVGDVKAYLRHRTRLGLSTNTIKKDYYAIKGFYKFIRFEINKESQIDLIELNEIDPGDFPTQDPTAVDPLEFDEVEALATAFNKQRNRIMVLVAVETGARSESLRILTLDDVDLEKNQIELKNTKEGGTYTGYISDQLALELERWIKVERKASIPDTTSDYLFPNQDGDHLSGEYLNESIKRAAERAGIQEVVHKREPTPAEKNKGVTKDYIRYYRVTTHTLRHTFSYILEQGDTPTEARSQALDHESIDTTKDNYSYEEIDYETFVRRFVHGNHDGDGDSVADTDRTNGSFK